MYKFNTSIYKFGVRKRMRNVTQGNSRRRSALSAGG